MLRMLNFSRSVKYFPALVAGAVVAISPALGYGQAIPMITQPVNESALVTLKGNTHPLATAEFDRGPVEDSVSGRMLLVLKRSPEQDTALRELVREQQDSTSPNYHKWLTPEQFGEKFGVADSDLQTVTGYLSANGFTVGRLYKNKSVIQVTGTAGQLRNTFHTQIHKYSIHGHEFYANASDPKIPAALAPVVRGFAALNNIKPVASEEPEAASIPVTFDAEKHTIKPAYTGNVGAGIFYLLSAQDIEKIYDIPVSTSSAGAGGKGVTVGVVGDSQINLNLIAQYESLSGINAVTPVEVVDGDDPSIVLTTTGPDATIAYEQLELVLAAAPNASLNYYTAAGTDYDTGLNFAIIRAIEDNAVSVLTIGFQTCEKNLTASGNALVESAWLQAAAQGITVVAAAGDSGSAGCDTPSFSSTTSAGGLAVNGYASTSYDTAVGGTDFYYGNPATPSNYWNQTVPTAAPYESALGYIPEQAWNDNLQTNDYVTSPTLPVSLFAGGGGFSTTGNVAADGVTESAYPVPSWQVNAQKASGVASPTVRSLPDVAMFAGNDYNAAQYAICAAPGDCNPTLTTATVTGGTAGAAAVFAGIMADVVEKYGAQGNANAALYGLSSSIYNKTTNPTGIFHDITLSSNAVACSGGTGCGSNGDLDSTGTTLAYNAGTGYDEATGLGSVDAGNLINGWKVPATLTTTTTVGIVSDVARPQDTPACPIPECTLKPGASVVHGTNLNLSATVAGSGTPTGNVAFTTNSPLPTYGGIIAAPLVSGYAVSNNNYFLPGGTYTITARYGGDSTYLSSVGTFPITVTPEPTRTFIYSNTYASGSSVVYGTPVNITAEPFSLNNNNVSTPTGTLGIYNNSNDPMVILPLSSEGTGTFSSNLLSGSTTYSLVFKYSGDPSYQPSSTSSTPYSITVTQQPTTTTTSSPNSVSTNEAATLVATVAPNPTSPATLTGVAPTGTVTFTPTTGTAQVITLIPGFSTSGQAISVASITVPAPPQTQISLTSAATTVGIFSDGTTVNGTNGLDGAGDGYSSNLLGTTLTYSGTKFSFGTANQKDAVLGSGQTITLSSGTYTNLSFLGTAVNGNQTGQVFKIAYSDGTTQSYTQSMSDWGSPQNYTGEATALSMAYRDLDNGTKKTANYNIYRYSFTPNTAKTVTGLILPNNADVAVLAITLTNNSAQSYTTAYSGDSNYASSTQNATVNANNTAYTNTSGVTISLNNNPVATNGTLTITATATQTSGTPKGTVQVYANGVSIGSFSITSGSATPWTVPLTNGYLPFASGTVTLTAVFTPNTVTVSPSTATTSLTVTDDHTVGDFYLTTVTDTQTITSSSNVVFFKVQLTSLQNFAGTNNAISLTCTVPGSSNLACSLGSPSTTLPSGGTAITTLSVSGNPTGGTGALHAPVQPQHWWLVGGGSALACILIIGIPARRKGLQGMFAMLMVAVIITGSISGCGSNTLAADAISSGTTGRGASGGNITANYTGGLATNSVAPGTYTVIVTATGTSNTTMVHNTSVKVVVTTGTVLANGSYSLTNFSNLLLVTDYNQSTTNGNGLIFEAADGKTGPTDQLWTFTYQNNGYYTIVNAGNGLYLTDPGGADGTGPDTQVTQASATGDGTQLWTLNPIDGGFEIVNAQSGGVLDDDGFGGAGTEVICYPQKNILDGINQTWYIQ